MKPLYISLVGPHSSGKRTLSQLLTNILELDYKVCRFNDNTPIQFSEDQEKRFSQHCKLMDSLIQWEQSILESDYDIVISSLSYHDIFVSAILTHSHYERLKQKYMFIEKRYDLLIFCDYLINEEQYIGEIGLYQTLVKPYADYILTDNYQWKRLKRVLNILDKHLEK